MPFHGVGIIVGGTIAVLGSGYAFKKFVYDPHLAHYVEAFIAQHPLLHSLSPSTVPPTEDARRGAPVPVPVSAISSARQPNLTHLRRRSVRGRHADGDAAMELETRQPLLCAGEREEYYLDAEDRDDWSKDRRATMKPVKPAEKASQRAPPQVGDSADNVSHSLVDLGDPVQVESPSTHASEIRSIIFDRDATPASPSAPPDIPADTVSPAGSRSRPTPLSDSWSASIPDLASSSADPTANDLDIIRPETAQSDYVDAESYTPFRDGASPTFPAFPIASPVPQSAVPTQLTAAAVARHDGSGGAAAEMGMSYIRLHTPAISELALGSEGRSVRRGPMSVVSLSSESEEIRSEDDWEAI